ncbi:TPA: hypothetical protein ACJHMO_003503, partial [Enterococcus faecalis]
RIVQSKVKTASNSLTDKINNFIFFFFLIDLFKKTEMAVNESAKHQNSILYIDLVVKLLKKENE